MRRHQPAHLQGDRARLTPSRPVWAAPDQSSGAPDQHDGAVVVAPGQSSGTDSGGASGEYDAEKVAKVGDSIASGTFKVNPAVIADKLIANAQELLSKVQS